MSRAYEPCAADETNACRPRPVTEVGAATARRLADELGLTAAELVALLAPGDPDDFDGFAARMVQEGKWAPVSSTPAPMTGPR